MGFDTLLNLLWAVLSLLALAASIRVWLKSKRESGKSRWLLVVGVGLIATALFPYVSATDDVLRIDRQNAQRTKSDAGKHHTRTDDLVRLYDAMDTSVVCRVARLSFALVFLEFVFLSAPVGIDRSTPYAAVRSPPMLSAAV